MDYVLSEVYVQGGGKAVVGRTLSWYRLSRGRSCLPAILIGSETFDSTELYSITCVCTVWNNSTIHTDSPTTECTINMTGSATRF